MTDSNPLVTAERLLANLVAAQDHIHELAVERDLLRLRNGKLSDDGWTLRLILKSVWAADAKTVAAAVEGCGLDLHRDVLPLIRIPEPATQ